ncbi:ParA family protein [Streptomyces xanthophaeus]
MTSALQTAIDTATKATRSKKIAVVQQKGGSGKSTIAINLAAVMGRSSVPHPDFPDVSPVLAAGIDVQATLEKWAGRVREDALPFDYLTTQSRTGVIQQYVNEPGRQRVIYDTPGFMDVDPDAEWGADPLGEGRAADSMREVLEDLDLAVVPITPSWLTHDPAEYTIERILKPRGIKFVTVINMHDPSKGTLQLDKAKKFLDDRGYPRMADPIRKYTLHENAAENGLVVTEYKMSGTALNGREDFMKLALCVEQQL